MNILYKNYYLEIAHWIRNGESKENFLHGHSFLFKVGIEGRILTKDTSFGNAGQVINVETLDNAFNRTIGRFNYSLLTPWNSEHYKRIQMFTPFIEDFSCDHLFCCGSDPTAEFLAQLAAHTIAEEIIAQGHTANTFYKISCQVFETEDLSAFYQTNFYSIPSNKGLLHEVWKGI